MSTEGLHPKRREGSDAEALKFLSGHRREGGSCRELALYLGLCEVIKVCHGYHPAS